MKEKKELIKRDKREWINYLIMLIAITILGLICLCASPFWKGILHNDFCVFQIMGKALLTNKTIYKELFDHKGPVIYVIHAIGILINKNYGMLLVEILAVFIGSVFVYKTSKFFLNNITSLLVSIMFIAFIFIPISNGGYTEDFACVFSAIGLYYIIKIMYNEEIENKLNWIIIGLTFSLNLFIKPTYVSLWIAFAIVALIKLIKNKQLKQLLKGILFAIIGVVIVAIPIIIYLLAKDCVKDFWDAYIGMNMKYSHSTLKEKVTAFLFLIKRGYYIVFILIILGNILLLFNKKLKKDIKTFILIYFITTVLLTAVAPNAYQHYLIQCATMLATETLLIFYSIQPFRDGEINKFIYYIIIFTVILITLLYNLKNGDTIFDERKYRDGEEIRGVLDKISTMINVDEDECLSIGNYPYVYRYINIYPKYKYFFQFPIGISDKTIGEETLKYIKERKPSAVVNGSLGKKDLNKIFEENLDDFMEEDYDRYVEGNIIYYILKQNKGENK